ncbi:MAG: adenylate/guanylate cyclase domain-containing protein, partial [Bacteroidota bacterium]
EKDYIIRNEASYVDKFTELIGDIQKKLNDNQRISQIRKDTILSRLENYEAKFLQMVALDKIIGIKDNTGAKKQLDERIALAETAFGNIVQSAQLWAKKEFNKLTWIYLSLGIALFVFSAFLSALIAKRITQPLTELTEHITQFVDSNFTLETEHPVIRTKDEIGSLTQNFSYLKDEVINRLKFFKQKVDERTAELASANSRLRRLSKANSRFVPDEFLDHLGKKGIEDIQLGDHVEREMTVIFTDIREFTQISESLTPQENFDFINTYLSGIVPIIQKHGGFIDKFIGDSVMALFPKKPDAALVTVLEFYDFLEQFNQTQLEKGKPKIQIGTGIHTGDLILGTIGHKNRLETTVISDAVNTAARIEGLNKYYGANILGTDSTLNKLRHAKKFNYRFLDSVRVKGKTKTDS